MSITTYPNTTVVQEDGMFYIVNPDGTRPYRSGFYTRYAALHWAATWMKKDW